MIHKFYWRKHIKETRRQITACGIDMLKASPETRAEIHWKRVDCPACHANRKGPTVRLKREARNVEV